MIRNSVDLPAPLGPVNAIRSGPRMSRSIPLSGTALVLPADLYPACREDCPSGGDVGVRQVEHDDVVVTHRTFGAVEPRPRVVDPFGVHVVALGRRLLGIALELASHDLRQTGILDIAGGGARPRAARSRACCIWRFSRLSVCSALRTSRLGDRCAAIDGVLVVGESSSVERRSHLGTARRSDPSGPAAPGRG